MPMRGNEWSSTGSVQSATAPLYESVLAAAADINDLFVSAGFEVTTEEPKKTALGVLAWLAAGVMAVTTALMFTRRPRRQSTG